MKKPAIRALALRGTVENSEFLGEFLRYEIRVGKATVSGCPARPRPPAHRARHAPGVRPASELRFVSA